jgi:hypothetical protein
MSLLLPDSSCVAVVGAYFAQTSRRWPAAA